MFTKIATLALVAATATAVPAAIDTRGDYAWEVKRFTSTCTAATCRYDFNISGPADDTHPSFDAFGCNGATGQDGYQPCTTLGIDVPGDVVTQEFNTPDVKSAIVSVQFSFESNDVKYTYEGNATVAHTNGGEPIDFAIVPTKATAV